MFLGQLIKERWPEQSQKLKMPGDLLSWKLILVAI